MGENNNKYHEWKKSVNQFLGPDFWSDFQGLFKDEWPHVNTYESDKTVLCLIALPGLQKLDDVHIYINHTKIEIIGHTTYSFSGFKTISEELPKGQFERTLDLPTPVHNKPIEAKFVRGMMSLLLKKIDVHEVSEIIIEKSDDT